MEEGLENTGQSSAVKLQASAEDENVVREVELVATKDEYVDMINSDLPNQVRTRLDAELKDEADCEEDEIETKENGEEAVQSEEQDSEYDEKTSVIETKQQRQGEKGELAEANAEETTNVEAESKKLPTIVEAVERSDVSADEEKSEEEDTEAANDGTEENIDENLQKAAGDEEKSEKEDTEAAVNDGNEENLQVLNKEGIKKGKKVDEEIREIVSHVVAESSSARTNNDRGSVIRHMDPKLYKAAVEGNVDKLNACMDLLDRPPRLTVLTPAGNSILHIHVAAPMDARSVNLEFLRTALSSSGLSLSEMRNDRQETPLHTAANFGQIKAVNFLMKKDPFLLNLTNVEGDTALHLAARNKQNAVVELMLTFPNSKRINYSTNYAGETPLYLAVQTGCLKLVTSMLNTIQSEQQLGSERTGTILHSAILWGNTEMAKLILKNFPKLIELSDEAGQTAVHYAAGIDNNMLRVIIEQQGENSPSAAYIQDTEGRTAAHIAAQQNNIDGLKLLMDHFPDCCEITDNQGRNVVHYAAFLGRIEALDFFIKDVRFCDLINKTDNEGNAPLHLLASSLTELPYASLRPLQLLLPELKALQLKIYNVKNLTPGDIANKCEIFELEPAYQDVVRNFRAVAPKGGRVKHWLQPLKEHKVDIEAQRKDLSTDILRTVKYHMVVSTLIATISFAAGLGVPGGFNQDAKDSVKGGSAMLGNKVAFRVFFISDCIALAFSLFAILCYFWIAVGKRKGSSKVLFFRAFEASTISIFALMVAFMCGTYSILEPSNKAFAVLVLLILSLFIYLYFIFAIGVLQLRIRTNRLMLRPKLQKMKTHVLHGQVDTHDIPMSLPFGLSRFSEDPFHFMVRSLRKSLNELKFPGIN